MTKEYFPHDYCARLSLRGIRKDYGLEGLGFYWCFVEMLHEEGGYIKEDELDNIAYDLQVNPELCRAVTHNYDLFTVKKGKIYSERVLRNIKKRAEISAARKKAANQRWSDDDVPDEEQPPAEKTPEEEEREAFLGAFQKENHEKCMMWFEEQLAFRFDEWEENESGDPFYSPTRDVRPLIENLFEAIRKKLTLTINGEKVETVAFLNAILHFFRNSDTKHALQGVIMEVNEKHSAGVIKNKQNYLISALYNTAKMSGA